MQEFELKAEAEMRLHSDRMAAELACKRREKQEAAESGTPQVPASAGGPRPAGAADAGGEGK